MLKVQDITLHVNDEDGEKTILQNVSLELEAGKMYVVTGPNGSGKSTLAKMLMGIMKPNSGRIIFDGQDITELSVTDRAKLGIGYAFQNPPRFKGIKVRDLLNIASGKSLTQDKMCGLLSDVGLCAQDYLDRLVDTKLSGGELKRIEIATVIARDLKIALFDEPEAGIDLWSFQKLAETFQTIHKKYNTTMLIISHQERILNLADEVILIANGKIREITDKDKVLSQLTFVSNPEANCQYKSFCEKGVEINVK